MMDGVFQEGVINNLWLKNRLVRSATWEGMCDGNGRPTEKMLQHYRDLAAGGVGLIITGYAYVRSDGKQLPGKMGLHDDSCIPSMRQLVDAVHDEGGTICVQLVHAGGQCDAANAGKPVAPSALALPQYPEIPAELQENDIKALIAAFGNAAARSQECGFDALQLHGAHGYLINQFLSPLTNRRTDTYGGTLENRCRFLLEVFQEVRDAVGEQFPVLIKLNGSDNLDGGLGIEDAVQAARWLDSMGMDAIEISGGTPASGDLSPARKHIDSPAKEGYNVELARRVKEAVDIPVMVVGGFRSFAKVEETIVRDGMDFVSMARPLIREPNLPQRWLDGDRAPARCISCNACFLPGIKEGGIYCVAAKKEKAGKPSPA